MVLMGNNFVTGQKWFVTRGSPPIEVLRNRGYTVYVKKYLLEYVNKKDFHVIKIFITFTGT